MNTTKEASLDDGDDDKVLNQSKLKDFFKQKRKRGRPKKANTIFDVEEGKPKSKKQKKKLETVPVSTAVKPKVTRTNWAKGEDKTKMDRAVKDWLEKTGDRVDSQGKVIIEWNHIVLLSKFH